METRIKIKMAAAAGLAFLATGFVSHEADAAAILCQDPGNEHMLVSDQYVSVCVDAGLGAIGQGNAANDDFLKANPGYFKIGDATGSSTNNPGGWGSTGTFSLDADLWNSYATIGIGFKFGTGNEADEWFVYLLQPNVSAGAFDFVENTKKGGSGLSGVYLYSTSAPPPPPPPGQVPEPSGLLLLGAGLLAFPMVRRFAARRGR